MNQANIDYLYQVFAPAADRSFGTSRSESDATGFGVHLNQASTSAFDVAHVARREDTHRTGSPSSDNRGVERGDSPSVPVSDDNRSDQHSPNNDDSNSAHTSCTACNSADSQAEESVKSTVVDSDASEPDKDASTGSEVAAEVAAAVNVQPPQTQVREPKVRDVHTKEAAAATAKASGVEPAAAAEVTKEKKATNTERIKSELQPDTSAEVSVADAGASDGEKDELLTSSPKDQPERTADASPTRPVEHSVSNKAESGDASTTTISETRALHKPVESTPNTEQAAASGDVKQQNASANKRTNSTVSDTDEDRSLRDRKSNVDATSTKGPVDGPPNTSIAAQVVNVQASNDADAESIASTTSDDEKTSTKPVANKAESALGPLGKSLRSAVEMTRGHKAASADDAPAVDPARFVSRVAKAIHTANERGGALQLRLAPPELGSLKIELNVKDGVMTAALEADNATARRLLLDHLPALRERLAEQNIRVERFDVDVRQDDTSGQAQSRGSNQNLFQQQAEKQNQSRRPSSVTNVGESAVLEPKVITTRITNTAINLVI